MFAIGIVFLIFLVLFGFVVSRSTELSKSEVEMEKINTCLLVSSLITSAFTGGNGVVVNVTIDYDVNINITDAGFGYKGIDVDGVYCLVPVHNTPNVRLEKGIVEIKNQNNYINLRNI